MKTEKLPKGLRMAADGRLVIEDEDGEMDEDEESDEDNENDY